MFKIHISIERWKFNKEYSIYVSSWGNLKDAKKKPKAVYANNGYIVAEIDGKLHSVHRLVLETFKPEGKELTVDHIDHNKRNNHLSNLRWLSRSENENDNNREEVIKTCEITMSDWRDILERYSCEFKQSAQKNSGFFLIEKDNQSFIVGRKKAKDFAMLISKDLAQASSALGDIKSTPFKSKKYCNFTYTWYPKYSSFLEKQNGQSLTSEK